MYRLNYIHLLTVLVSYSLEILNAGLDNRPMFKLDHDVWQYKERANCSGCFDFHSIWKDNVGNRNRLDDYRLCHRTRRLVVFSFIHSIPIPFHLRISIIKPCFRNCKPSIKCRMSAAIQSNVLYSVFDQPTSHYIHSNVCRSSHSFGFSHTGKLIST